MTDFFLWFLHHSEFIILQWVIHFLMNRSFVSRSFFYCNGMGLMDAIYYSFSSLMILFQDSQSESSSHSDLEYSTSEEYIIKSKKKSKVWCELIHFFYNVQDCFCFVEIVSKKKFCLSVWQYVHSSWYHAICWKCLLSNSGFSSWWILTTYLILGIKL